MVYGIILLGILFLLLIGSYICYRLAFLVSERKMTELFDMLDTEQYAPYKEQTFQMFKHAGSIPYEEVWIETFDGEKLFGKYYEVSQGAAVQIMFHGYRSVAEIDFCGGLPFALAEGYNVLLVDQRAHGRSSGKCLTFGVKERYDCVSWVNYVIERFGKDTRIILYGMSMGAATVMMAAGLSLPENVKGIVADCGYTSPAAILKKVLRDRHYPVWIVYPLVRLGGRIFGGFDTEEASAREAMTHCSIPVLLIHGEDDDFVPCYMSVDNYEACILEHKKLLTFPGAGHALSYFLDEERYVNGVRSFIKACLL